MASAMEKKAETLQSDSGLFHLTGSGWVRKDAAPYPEDRAETWQYEMERPHPDTKQIVHLTRIWISPSLPDEQIQILRKRYGGALAPTADRHVILDCHV